MAALAKHTNTGDPVLCLLQPNSLTEFTIDAYMSINNDFVQVPPVDIGPIAAENHQ
jgi:hypothetical protein